MMVKSNYGAKAPFLLFFLYTVDKTCLCAIYNIAKGV